MKVGSTNRIGLYDPLRAATDVLQQARAASVTSNYAHEAVGTVDPIFSTVSVTSLQDGDSLQWQLITAR